MKVIAKRYAELLTKGDVMKLFRVLEKVGSLSEACRLAGIDRKTVYNWERVREIRRETKAKVLAAALELRPRETLEFVADRAVERATEVVSHLLLFVFEQAMRAEDPREFERLHREFLRLVAKYDRPLIESVRHEVNEHLYRLDRKRRRVNARSHDLSFT